MKDKAIVFKAGEGASMTRISESMILKPVS